MAHRSSRRDDGTGRRSGSGRPPRKTLQLCEQVRQTLEYVLTGELGDDLLRMMYVARVEPAPDAARLLVTVVPMSQQDPPDPAAVISRLHEHAGRLRSAVAGSISRRKAPDLMYRYLDTDPAANAPTDFEPRSGEEE